MNLKKRKNRLNIIFILSVALFMNVSLIAKVDLKNVIIISVDTLRADHLGCYGYPLNTSPVIDALAGDGVLFSHCYTPTPLTGPAFSTMLSSLPPYKHGAKRNGLSIYRDVKTLPYYLKRFGYRSAAIISNWPLRKKLARLHKHFDQYNEVFTRKRYLGIMNPEGDAPTVTRKALRWVERNHQKRFFLWIQYSDPHAVYVSHKGFTFDYRDVDPSVYPPGTRMKKIKKYDSEIAFTDFHIGKLMAKLKGLGLYDDSLIIFVADHGESFGEHNYLRHGRKLYNSTLHVPLIVKLPGNRLKNTSRQQNVSLLDIGPTIFSTLGISTPPPMEGIELFKETDPFLLSQRKITFEAYAGNFIFRRNSKKYKLKVKPVKYGVLQGPVKLIYNPKSKTYETYRINEDPFETTNIYQSNPLLVAEMKGELFDTISQIKRYIQRDLAKSRNRGTISEEDLKKLKSLGYIDD